MQTQNFAPAYDYLPEELQMAQSAIEKPEIQEILKMLSKYNLGITMPHKHNVLTGAFEVLQEDEMQMENELSVSFMKKDAAAKLNSIPVSWMWSANAVTASQQCVTGCLSSDTAPHRPIHNPETEIKG